MATIAVEHEVSPPITGKNPLIEARVRLVTNDRLQPAHGWTSAGRSVAGERVVKANSSGLLRFPLEPNTDVGSVGDDDLVATPTGTMWEIVVTVGSVRQEAVYLSIDVGDGPGPVQLVSLIQDPPTGIPAPASLLAQQAAEAAESSAAAAVAAAAAKVAKAGDTMTGDLVVSAADINLGAAPGDFLDQDETKVKSVLGQLTAKRRRRYRDRQKGRYAYLGEWLTQGSAVLGDTHHVIIGDSLATLGGLDGAIKQVNQRTQQVPELVDSVRQGFYNASGFGGFTGTCTATSMTDGGPGGYYWRFSAGNYARQTGVRWGSMDVIYYAVPLAQATTIELRVGLAGLDEASIAASSVYDSWSTGDASVTSGRALRIRRVNTLVQTTYALSPGWGFELKNAGANQCDVAAVVLLNGAGAHIERWGHSGSKLSDWGSGTWATDLAAYLTARNTSAKVDAVTVSLGTNDYADGASTLNTRLRTLLTNIAAAVPLATLNLAIAHEPVSRSDWDSAFVPMFKRVVDDFNISAVVDNYDVIGSIDSPDSYGFNLDGVHLSTRGSYATALNWLEELWEHVGETGVNLRADGSRAMTGALALVEPIYNSKKIQAIVDFFGNAKFGLWKASDGAYGTNRVLELRNDYSAQPAWMMGDGSATPAKGMYLATAGSGDLTATGPIDLTTAGATGTASKHAAHRGYAETVGLKGAPTGALCETVPRYGTTFANIASSLTSGTVYAHAVWLPKGAVVANVTWVSGTTAGSGMTNQWAGIATSARVIGAISADGTSGAWGSNTAKTFAMGSSYTVPSDGVYYLFVMVAGTPPTLQGKANGNSTINAIAPSLCGTSSTGQTTPPSVGATLSAISVTANSCYAYAT